MTGAYAAICVLHRRYESAVESANAKRRFPGHSPLAENRTALHRGAVLFSASGEWPGILRLALAALDPKRTPAGGHASRPAGSRYTSAC